MQIDDYLLEARQAEGRYGTLYRAQLTPRTRPAEESPPPPPPGRKTAPPPPPRLDWAALHQRSFGNDVLQCPCGGRRTVRRVHLTRKAAEARLVELGVRLPSRLLPPPTAPPQLALDM